MGLMECLLDPASWQSVVGCSRQSLDPGLVDLAGRVVVCLLGSLDYPAAGRIAVVDRHNLDLTAVAALTGHHSLPDLHPWMLADSVA